MNYEEALAYLHSLQRFGMKMGLERTSELLRRVGRPDRRAGQIIHITGTSGKGSVAALAESALRAASQRVGLYTSPSLENFTDRIQVDRQQIPEQDLADVVAMVKPHVEAMVTEGLEQPTEFEVTTVAALLYFAAQRVDWLVLEAGLGGRLDATTAAQTPVITCITNIGLDHTDVLGSTHEEIAADKAGIIKPGIPCVTGSTHPGALTVIREAALTNAADLVEVTDGDYAVQSHESTHQIVRLLGARGWYRDLSLSLLGRHQAANAAVALRLVELAGVSEQAIRAGFARAVWPGRFEILRIPGLPLIILDAAHNPAKCEALAEAIGDYCSDQPVSLVLGVLADKNVTAMVGPLLARADRLWVTTPESPRRLDAAHLAEVCAGQGRGAVVVPEIGAAVDQAVRATGPSGIVLVTGSFYTVGPARRHLRSQVAQE